MEFFFFLSVGENRLKKLFIQSGKQVGFYSFILHKFLVLVVHCESSASTPVMTCIIVLNCKKNGALTKLFSVGRQKVVPV